MTRTIKRPVEVAGQLAYEKHSIRMFMVDTKAAQVDAELTDGSYSYKVGASDISVFSDEEFVERLGASVGAAVGEALKGGM